MNPNRILAMALVGAAVYLALRTPPCPGPKCPAPTPSPTPAPAPAPPPPPPPKAPQPPRRPWAEQTSVPVGAPCCQDEATAYRDALQRAEQRWKERRERARKEECPVSCRCGRCDDGCLCRAIGRPCGGAGCTCIVTQTEESPAIDLLAVPREGRPRNVGGRDGAGLCVFTSIQYAAWWQNEARLRDFQSRMRSELGGGYPSKVDKMIAKYAPGVRYLQYEGRDPSIIELALKTGRLPCVTWNGNHMLNCVHLDASRGAILDNNAPDRVQWFGRQQFLSKWQQGGGGWVVVLLNPGPPPPPRSRILESQQPARIIRGVQPAGPPLPPIYGMDWSPAGDEPKWSLNGRPCTEFEALAAVLADDSSRPHLTVIGPESERVRVMQDLETASALAPFRERFRVQAYSPDAWELTCGFVTSGHPTLYLQDPQGRVLLRLDRYDGPDALAGALRRADPSYNPATDPTATPSFPRLPGLPDLSQVPFVAWVLGGLGVLLFFRKDSQK